MKQRLGLAGVLLGDPHTVLLDEPANGLDPEGIRWIRDLLLYLAGQGRTVFVSSHQLSEISLMAQDLVVIGRGRLIETSTVTDFVDRHARRWVRVRSPQLDDLLRALTFAGPPVDGERVRRVDDMAADVHGLSCEQVGEAAARVGAVLHELSPQVGSLEEAFLAATAEAQEYRSHQIQTSEEP
jgi:ABC-2 type transport system ATP-binding protein